MTTAWHTFAGLPGVAEELQDDRNGRPNQLIRVRCPEQPAQLVSDLGLEPCSVSQVGRNGVPVALTSSAALGVGDCVQVRGGARGCVQLGDHAP